MVGKKLKNKATHFEQSDETISRHEGLEVMSYLGYHKVSLPLTVKVGFRGFAYRKSYGLPGFGSFSRVVHKPLSPKNRYFVGIGFAIGVLEEKSGRTENSNLATQRMAD